MEILETTDAMVEAIMSCKDKEEVKTALRVLVGFAFHDSGAMTTGIGQQGLPNKVTLSLLMVAVQNMSKPNGGD